MALDFDKGEVIRFESEEETMEPPSPRELPKAKINWDYLAQLEANTNMDLEVLSTIRQIRKNPKLDISNTTLGNFIQEYIPRELPEPMETMYYISNLERSVKESLDTIYKNRNIRDTNKITKFLDNMCHIFCTYSISGMPGFKMKVKH